MAQPNSLSGVLAGIPGLRGWQAQDQFRQEQMQGDQTNQLNQMKLAEMFQGMQDKKNLAQALQTQSDPNTKLEIVMKAAAGGNQHAAALLPILKEQMAQQKTQLEEQNQQTMNGAMQAYQGAEYQDASGKMVPVDQAKVAQNLIGDFGTKDEQKKVMESIATKPANDYSGKREVTLADGTIGVLDLSTNKITKTTEKARPTASAMSSLNADMLTPDAITQAAEKYRITGNMPSLGMGSAIAKSRILNKAAELAAAAGDTGQAAAYRQMQGKADQQALGQLEKQATMVGAFEKTANSNLLLAVSLSDKVSRSGSPVFDKWVQMGRKSIAGDPDVAKFHAANETFINEYAKIMSGSMGNTAISDAARTNAHEVLNHAFTKEQYREVTNTLKTEMQNRIKGFNDQRDEVKTRLTGGNTSAPTVTAPPVSAQETKVINGKTYTKINGQWHE